MYVRFLESWRHHAHQSHRLGLIGSLFCILFCTLFFALLIETPTRAQSAPQATAIAVGGDNLTRLLWNNPDASISLWKLNADGTVATQFPYGPYTGYAAQNLAAGADGAPWTEPFE